MTHGVAACLGALAFVVAAASAQAAPTSDAVGGARLAHTTVNSVEHRRTLR